MLAYSSFAISVGALSLEIAGMRCRLMSKLLSAHSPTRGGAHKNLRVAAGAGWRLLEHA
jgi:hypothetical protein